MNADMPARQRGAMSGREQMQQNIPLLDHLVLLQDQALGP
jgi:hypothetical protein